MAQALRTPQQASVAARERAIITAPPVLAGLRAPAPCRGLQAASVQLAARRAVAAHVVVKSRSQRADTDIDKVLFSTEQLNEVLDDLGRTIGSDYADKDLLMLGVLKGGFVFTADLVRHLSPVPKSVEVDFIKVASYGLGISSSGQVHIDDAFDLAVVKDKHVLVVEDIIDTGLTMSTLVKRLRQAGAMSVRVVVLLDKRARRQVTYDADYVGIQCPDEFVVGFGIDFAERYRWLPYIGVPKPEVVAALKAERAKQQLEEERARLEAAQRRAQQQQEREQQEQEERERQARARHGNGHSASMSSNGSAKGAGSSGPSVSSVVSANGLLLKVGGGNGAVAAGSSNSNGAHAATTLLAKPVAKNAKK